MSDVPWLGELDQSPATDCAVVAFLGLCAFATDDDSLMTIPERELFERFNIPSNPEFGPTEMADLLRMVAASFPGHTLDGVASWSEAVGVLHDGGTIAVSGLYSRISPQYRYTSYLAGHAIRCYGLRTTDVLETSVSDALGPRHWVPVSEIANFATSPGYGIGKIRVVHQRGEWSAMKFTPYTPSDIAPGSVATLQTATGAPASSMKDVDKRIRMFRTDTGAEVIPNSPTYPVGLSGMAGPPHPEASFVVSQSGIDSPVILLKRNTVVTPAAATPATDQSFLVHLSIVDGVPSLTKA